MNKKPGSSSVHESGHEHANGSAVYVADLPVPKGTLIGRVVYSPHAHAKILRRCANEARKTPGVEAIYFADDIPGDNLIGPIIHDEPLLAEEIVEATGQAVALIVGHTAEACRIAAEKVEVDYEPLPAILTIRDAVDAQSFLTTPHRIQRGDVEGALNKIVHKIIKYAVFDKYSRAREALLAIVRENTQQSAI